MHGYSEQSIAFTSPGRPSSFNASFTDDDSAACSKRFGTMGKGTATSAGDDGFVAGRARASSSAACNFAISTFAARQGGVAVDVDVGISRHSGAGSSVFSWTTT